MYSWTKLRIVERESIKFTSCTESCLLFDNYLTSVIGEGLFQAFHRGIEPVMALILRSVMSNRNRKCTDGGDGLAHWYSAWLRAG
jgi:hypothetical protein